jgi:hypothetical protein
MIWCVTYVLRFGERAYSEMSGGSRRQSLFPCVDTRSN